jgi:hypothetical protein
MSQLAVNPAARALQTLLNPESATATYTDNHI